MNEMINPKNDAPIKKWNWGKGVILMIAIFFIAWIALIWFVFQQKVDLVATNYYEQGLKYEKELGSKKNALALPIIFSQTTDSITLRFPRSVNYSDISGMIQFYHPADSRFDRKLSIQIDTTGTQMISTKSQIRGRWKVFVAWNSGGVDYSDEWTLDL